MIIAGYRQNADFFEAPKTLTKHLTMSGSAARRIMNRIENGEAVKVDNDFVLREDLEALGFIVE